MEIEGVVVVGMFLLSAGVYMLLSGVLEQTPAGLSQTTVDLVKVV